MIVDNGKLTALLVDETGMSKEQVEQQLQKLVSEVQTGTARGKDVLLKGFGVFKQEGDIIRFEPAEILQIEINQKYAGMKPIELMGSFRESRPGIPVKTPRQTVTETERLSAQSGEKQQQAGVEKPVAKEQTEHEALDKITERLQEEEQDVAPKLSKPKPSEKSVATSEKETGTMGIVLIVISIIIALLLAVWLLYESGVFV